VTAHVTRVKPGTTTGGLNGHRWLCDCGKRGRVYLGRADAEAWAARHVTGVERKAAKA
jgi:hypothetical protein